MKELWRLARAIRGKGAPVLQPVFPYELGTKKLVQGQERTIKIVPHKRQKVKLGTYVIMDEPENWIEIGKNIYATRFVVPTVKQLQVLIYDKEMTERGTTLTDKAVKALLFALAGYAAYIVKNHNRTLPSSCFDQYWWNDALKDLGITYLTPLKSWTAKDYVNILRLLKEKVGEI